MTEANEQSLQDWFRSQAQIRLGRDYINEKFVAKKTALVVVDMQNYFMKPGFLAACPMAIEIVPAINKMADNLRSKGGLVVWIQTSADPEATKDWGVYKEFYTPENWQRRNIELAEDHQGYAIWPELTVLEKDLRITKSRFSAFIDGSSDINEQLRSLNIDTLLVSGVATDVCCESTARDAMMLNYRTTMVLDALASMTNEAHSNSLKALYGMFADVQTCSEISTKLV
ncbi:cysteine hydrolase [Gammaproteobacteria bacterium]|nr:cysteine hydrolase [Gammaproteobacteria bacterium]